MKALYIDCGMGCAGDMLAGALLELHPDPKGFLEKMNRALCGLAVVDAVPDEKCGIHGTHYSVLIHGQEEMPGEHPGLEHHHHEGHQHDAESLSGADEPEHHHHHHTGVHEILHLIEDHTEFPEEVKADAKEVYTLIAQAECQVHGQDMEHIHFHEVGSLDALADVLSVCALIHDLAPEQVYASPVHVGSGTVKCAHGILPVPAPATELLLRGIPIYSGNIKSELCTPTGAALLKHFVSSFGDMPVMRTEAAGYGTGKKNFETANVVRVLLGNVEAGREQLCELVCNLDDMTPEEIGFAQECLFAAGALDVYTTNIGMKKCRPAVMLTCMCKCDKRQTMLECIFRNTTTLGIREYICNRYQLTHHSEEMETAYGSIHMKTAEGYGVCRSKPEFEDIAKIARISGKSLREVKDSLRLTDVSSRQFTVTDRHS